MWIEHAISPHVAAVAKQFPALLLTGPRQTGKTALLERLFPQARFVTLDLPSVAYQAETEPEALLARHPEPVPS